MSGSSIEPDDLIARCIIFPLAFREYIHIDAMLFSFGESDESGASHASGILCKMHNGEAEIHGVGCSIVAFQNDRRGTPRGSEKRRYYCGSRFAKASQICQEGDSYKVTLSLDGENGQASHVDIALYVQAETRNKRATIKTEAALVLAEVFGGVSEHICACDDDDDGHPLKIDPQCLTKGIERHDRLSISA